MQHKKTFKTSNRPVHLQQAENEVSQAFSSFQKILAIADPEATKKKPASKGTKKNSSL